MEQVESDTVTLSANGCGAHKLTTPLSQLISPTEMIRVRALMCQTMWKRHKGIQISGGLCVRAVCLRVRVCRFN